MESESGNTVDRVGMKAYGMLAFIGQALSMSQEVMMHLNKTSVRLHLKALRTVVSVPLWEGRGGFGDGAEEFCRMQDG